MLNRKQRTKNWQIAAIVSIASLISAFILAFTFGPTIVDRRFNPVQPAPLAPIQVAAETLHQSLTIADLHADSLLWSRDLSQLSSHGHVDVLRLIQGNVALQTFTVVTKVPSSLKLKGNSADSDTITQLAVLQRWPSATWFSLKERAIFQAKRLQILEQKAQGKFHLIRNQQDLQQYLQARTQNPGMTAGLLGLEGAQALEGQLEAVQALDNAGFRMIGLTHFFDNEVAGSAHGLTQNGLTEFGRAVIRELEQRQIIIDLAHASALAIDEVLEMATRPVLVSHTGVKGTCDNDRNLSDDQIQRIAQAGGLIGIGFWPTAVCGTDASAIVKAIRYVTDLVGVEHVALGSDYDGAVRVPFDVAHLSQVTNALLEDGVTESEIRKIMGLNVIQFLEQWLPESRQS